ncbi:metallophosphoesterase [Candidatus Bathyarchaeota archaeon]|nr:metallophosphoesterase [Candidatus Bathyarchaeota archaeon]
MSVILIVALTASTLGPALVRGYTAEVITGTIASPLPTRPEPVLIGGTLDVVVKSASEPGTVSARVYNPYDSASLTLSDTSAGGDETYTLTFKVPDDILPGLYSLNLAYTVGGNPVNVTQSRCVWTMEEWPTELTIGHISDIHLPYGADWFARYAYETNLVNPDMVIITGDIVDVETIAAAWSHFQGTLQQMDQPTFALPGNHDYTSGSVLWQKYGGMLNYSITMGDFLFVALNSRGGGFIEPPDLVWAEKVLQENPDKVKIIGFHHPLLSSEYEDDEGAVTGGEITGSYTDIEELTDAMYFTWLANMDEATEILRLIETYDVRLILAGHVHRDMIYILNGEHYFVTTTAIGGGLPENSYHGSRLITIDDEGNVKFDWYADMYLFEPPNSVPTGELSYLYKKQNNGTQKAVSAHIENGLEMPLDDARLEFIVNGDNDVSSYSFYPEEPDSYETYTTAKGHRFVAYMDLSESSTYDLTLASETDSEEPAITLHLPESYDSMAGLNAVIEVTDAGWGVSEVEASYSMDGGASWTPLALTQEPGIASLDWVYTYESDYYEVTIPDASGEVTLKVEAADFAGNTASSEATTSSTPTVEEYTLTVESEPSGVTVMVNGDTETTPYAETLEEGFYTVEAQPSVTVGGAEYTFTEWGDGETSTSRTVDLSSDTTLTILYEEVQEEPEPEHEEEPSGGIPIPPAFIIAGVLASLLVRTKRKRRL